MTPTGIVETERNGVYRHWTPVDDWSVAIVPKCGNMSLRSLRSPIENEPSRPVLGVMRHPLERIISAWTAQRQLLFGWDIPWESFLQEIANVEDPDTLDRHLRPVAWYWGPFPPEKAIRLDQLSEFLPAVPRHNRSYHKDVESMYQPHQAVAMELIYREDMALWRDLE